MNKAIYSSEHFRLLEWRHRKSNKVHYRVAMMTSWQYINGETVNIAEQVRDIVDPTRCRSGKAGTHWKYRSLDEATKAYTFLVMRFP
jgi:hypothetical protein